MHIVFGVEHDLLPVALRRIMVHASISCLAANFVECGAVIGEDAEEGCAAGARAAQDEELVGLASCLAQKPGWEAYHLAWSNLTCQVLEDCLDPHQ
jgi:hypothetical protein